MEAKMTNMAFSEFLNESHPAFVELLTEIILILLSESHKNYPFLCNGKKLCFLAKICKYALYKELLLRSPKASQPLPDW